MSGQLDNESGRVDGTAGQVDNLLTIARTAEHLGISERTVRRRIKSGDLQAFQVPTAQGYEWRVQLDGTPVNLPGNAVKVDGTDDRVDTAAGQDSGQVDGEALMMALELVDQMRADNTRLQRENVELAGRLGFYQARVQQLEGEVLALKAPEPEHARPPLWRRLFQLSPA